ncbi:MAG TPA: hypothetical protein VGO11_07090 [Chthoniobacteraceae bacterium]|nr:hypothetical protein [Chthoniobacteraceae bacterium]
MAVLPLAVHAAETAYTAIRVVAKKVGDEALGRVIEVRGKAGSPEPQVWKVVLADERARGGVHEYEVQRGKISGDRSPTGGHPGIPLDLNKVNIDSDGAFTIVNQEAQKAHLPFDRVDYVLTNTGRVSIWHMEIFDGRNGRVGSLEIAADSGNVTNRDLQGAGHPPAQDDREFLRDQAARDHRGPGPGPGPVYDEGRRPPRDDRREYRDDDDLGPGIFDIVGKITRHFEKRGRQVKSFFGH